MKFSLASSIGMSHVTYFIWPKLIQKNVFDQINDKLAFVNHRSVITSFKDNLDNKVPRGAPLPTI